MQKTLATTAALSGLPLGFEMYLEHYKGSFGDIWMWSPIVTSPLVSAAGLAGMRSPAAARTVLPAAGAVYALNGLIGTYTHLRGVARKPGGFSEPTYNLVMGPPLLAPGSLILVGAIALLAGDRPAGALTVAFDFRRAPITSPSAVPADSPTIRTSCPARGEAARRRCTAAIRITTCSMQAGHWDPVTREMVLARVHDVPEIRFFTACRGGNTRRAVRRADRPGLRAADPGHQLHRREVRARASSTDFSSTDMPDDREAWRLVAQGLDEEAATRAGAASFAAADAEAQLAIVGEFARGTLAGGAWEQLNVKRAFGLVMRVVLAVLLLPPVGLERDRLRRAGLPARLQPLRQPRSAARRARDVGGRARHYDRDPVTGEREQPPAMSGLARQPHQGHHPDAPRQRLGVAA